MNRPVSKAVDQQTIVALCTPQGSGALGLIRLCGQDVFEVVDKMAKLSSGRKLSEEPTHTIQHGFVVDTAPSIQFATQQAATQITQDERPVVIDEVLFFLMRGPRTFTGQDTIEISCHNNQFIIEKIIQLSCQNGARPARAGEFSKRAVLNGKLNLVQAEAINDLIHAQNELALKKSIEQLGGTLSHFLAKLEADFVSLLGLVEASFEFVEEEQKDIDLNLLIKTRSMDILQKLDSVKINFNQQKQIREGIKIALIGLVNTGKSTLFNALLNQDRAIVSELEGTTRDSIESSIYKNGVFWTFIDTAGLRQAGDVIEKQGIERSLSQAQQADLILLVFDVTQKLSNEQKKKYQEIIDLYSEKVIFVVNKIDEKKVEKYELGDFLKDYSPVIEVSAAKGNCVVELIQLISDKIETMFFRQQSHFLLNQRQARLINQIELKFDSVVKSQLDSLEYELIAYQLKEILELISELTGRDISECVLDSVFDEFCVGK